MSVFTCESDDLIRSQPVQTSSNQELRCLVQSVRPLYRAINAYLDQTGDDERAVPYGDLATTAVTSSAALALPEPVFSDQERLALAGSWPGITA